MSSSEADPTVASHVLREIEQGFLGESRAAAAVREQIADFLARHRTKHAPRPILLRGEAGVGKSLLAQLIHRAGPRRDGPFVDFNCTSIPASRLEWELFGYEKIGFGSDEPFITLGLLERARRGTLFLDHMTELPQGLQATLLKAIERRRVRRIGGRRDEPIDVWIVATTYEDLIATVDDHRRYREAFNLHEPSFVENLYQQLGKLDNLLIPPLRQRSDDILLLAEHFLARACAKHALPPKEFAADARSALLAYPWPGNVLEVKNVIERVALHLAENDIITAAMLTLPNWNDPPRRP